MLQDNKATSREGLSNGASFSPSLLDFLSSNSDIIRAFLSSQIGTLDKSSALPKGAEAKEGAK